MILWVLPGSQYSEDSRSTCRMGREKELLKALVPYWHDHASRALIIRELLQTLIKV